MSSQNQFNECYLPTKISVPDIVVIEYDNKITDGDLVEMVDNTTNIIEDDVEVIVDDDI